MGEGASLIISGDVRIYLTASPALEAANNDLVTINLGGSLKLYTDGTIAFNNNVSLNNLTQLPSKFMIYSTYDSTTHLDSHGNQILAIDINNNASFYGTIYAAKGNISLDNNAAVFGAMVGNTINVSNNDQVHFDEALRTVIDPNATPALSSWQEI